MEQVELSISFFIKNNPNYKKIIKNIYFIDDNENVLKKIYKWFSYNRLQSI